MSTASLSKACTDCSAYLRGVRGYSVDTLGNYERTWHQFMHYLHGQGCSDEVRHFTVERVMDWCADLGTRGIHPNTIRNKIAGLSTLARFLMKRRDGRGRPLLTENPCHGFEKPRAVQQETKFMHPEELAKVMTLPCAEGLHLARILFMDTGIRCWELTSAKAGDLRQVGDQWILSVYVKGRRQEGAAPAQIPVSPDVAEQLVAALNRREASPTDPLIVTTRGTPFTRSQMSQAMIRLGRRAGITRLNTSPHKFRHTANVIARMSGLDPVLRAQMLNHSSTRTLARYDHLMPGEVSKGREIARAGFDSYLRLAPGEVHAKPTE